jgi:hypothetical protein
MPHLYLPGYTFLSYKKVEGIIIPSISKDCHAKFNSWLAGMYQDLLQAKISGNKPLVPLLADLLREEGYAIPDDLASRKAAELYESLKIWL